MLGRGHSHLAGAADEPDAPTLLLWFFRREVELLVVHEGVQRVGRVSQLRGRLEGTQPEEENNLRKCTPLRRGAPPCA